MHRLKIFVSGKEGELDAERNKILNVIDEMGFESLASETRPANTNSPSKVFVPEVQESDIYVGVFGEKFSPSSIEEFTTARKTEKATLLFFKDQANQESELQQFVSEIQNQLYFKKFSNLSDLAETVKNSLVNEITDEYRKSVSKIESIVSKNIEIVEWNCPENIGRGKPFQISAKVKGSIKKGFLDFMIKESKERRYWFPDTEKYSELSARGTLDLDDDSYTNEWFAQIPEIVNPGTYTAFMGIYEDIETGPTWNRRLLDWKEKDIRII